MTTEDETKEEDEKWVGAELEELVGSELLEEFWDVLGSASRQAVSAVTEHLADQMHDRVIKLVGRRNYNRATKAIEKRAEKGPESLSEEEQRLIDYLNGDPVMLHLSGQMAVVRRDFAREKVEAMLRAAIESLTNVETPEAEEPGAGR
jgi:hypothetical protein